MNERVIPDEFGPILGQSPWRVRLGWGSFLTFDFGPRIKKDRHYYGTWHLWVQHCDWRVESDSRIVVTSESARHLIETAMKNFEKRVLRNAEVELQNDVTTFTFDRLRLVCTPYKDQEVDEDYWCFFSPRGVLKFSPKLKLNLEEPPARDKVSV
jgi:hypothetical protein